MRSTRLGMGRGRGTGYKNLAKTDPKIHSNSAKGRKTYCNPIGNRMEKEAEHLQGGLADNIHSSNFAQKQIEKGTKIEMEHTNDPKIAREIAKDHLMENDHYYDHLEEMEKKYSPKA